MNSKSTIEELKEVADIERVIQLFHSKCLEVVRAEGMQEVNYLQDGIQFMYNGKKIELMIKLK